MRPLHAPPSWAKALGRPTPATRVLKEPAAEAVATMSPLLAACFADELQLPAVDPFRGGVEPLVDALPGVARS